MIAPQSRSVQQLAEVLATLVSSSTEAEATQGAVERVAECFDSEVGAMVRDGAVVASVGFRRDGPVPPALVTLAAGNGGTVEVPGAGPCVAVVVAVPSESPSRLLLARSGGDGYSLEEVSLLRSMGRILANGLDMLRLRDMVAANEARFRRIVETANEGIWLLGVDGTTTFANDKTAEILGYPPDEMATVSLFDVLDESGKAQAARNLERRRRGISDQLECAFFRKDRSRVWVLLNASPLLDGEGAFIGSLCMISDISHRKHIEEELRETTARFRLLQAMATAANEASGLEEVLQVAVDEICAHTGWVGGHAYLPAGALGDSVVPMSIWRRDDAGEFGALREALVPARPAPAAGLVGRVLRERSPVWAELAPGHGLAAVEEVATELGLAGAFAFPVCVGGEVTCILEFFSPAPMAPDAMLLETIGQVATQLSRVAERQRANNELATARDAAMESSRLKSDFLATMSHEIRTPMNGVIGLTGLLLSTDLDGRQRQYAEGVQSAGEALLAIINDILDFSKIEAGRLELEVIDFDLVQVIEEAAGLVASPAQRKGLELVTSCPASLPGRVRGDPARLRQILLNLASNAVKFTLEGEVVMRARVVDDAGDDVTVRFEVTDTGIGISEADGRRLFEPFSQADASTTRRFGGTGLGLAISRRLAAAMGGELGFDSAVGRGSTFWFTLPLQRQAGAPAPAPAASGSVLIVDDTETSRAVLREQLGAGADVVADGVAGLRMLRSAAARGQSYGFAVIDAGMPGMDGVELVRRIASDPALAATRLVLLVTAASSPGRFTCPSGVTCLTKPVRVSQLAEALQAAGPPTVRASSLPATPPPEIRGHVLVVEDNASNQLVAVGILRLLGYRADVASDGTEALDALDRVQYDAILMDCQMPEMDGFTATREIRRREGPDRHTPVIAMTAGASDSDRDQCLSAGMDDFLSKPVKPRDIDAMLARWVVGGDAAGAGEPVLDRDVLEELRQLTPDGSLLADIVDTYLGTVPDHITQLQAAVAAGDAGAVRQCAHRLRGESSAVGAVEVAALCRSLEEQSIAGRLDGAPALFSFIVSAYERAAGELRAFVGAGAGAR
ncbi:MAG TPA: response regulator [Acidimicrobiales bacterium]|nr:response regulator [Acidimicrobiales bacterium]